MPNSVFAVVLDEPNAESSKRLQDAYADRHTISGTVSLVRAGQLTEEVAVTAGLKGEDRIANGVVFKLTRFYSGHTLPTVWEWLSRDEEAG